MRSFYLQILAGILFTALLSTTYAETTDAPPKTSLDIAPFALPNSPPGEIGFEQPRDILKLHIEFVGAPPKDITLSYRQKNWPAVRLEIREKEKYPFGFGWAPVDDWFTTVWHKAAINVIPDGPHAIWLEFQNLSAESFSDFNPKEQNYDVNYRRTLALKIDTQTPDNIKNIAVYTTSPVTHTSLNVRFDIQQKTFEKSLRLSGYNALLETPITLNRTPNLPTAFQIAVRHLKPTHKYNGDDGLVMFELDDELFTISLTSLADQGPIWFPEKGIFITQADDPTTFEQYQTANQNQQTIADRVNTRTIFPKEQSRYESYVKQPRPHGADYNIGCALAAQKFTIEREGNLRLSKRLFRHEPIGGKKLDRMKLDMTDAANRDNGARLIFGQTRTRNLDDWRITARFPDPEPALIYNLLAQRRGLTLEQKFLALPVMSPILGQWACDDPMTAIVRLRFENHTDQPELLAFPLHYSQANDRPFDTLIINGQRILSEFKGQNYLRFTVQTAMQITADGDHITLRQTLQPGQSCSAIVKVPFITLESPDELNALDSLDFDKACTDVTAYWRREAGRGATLRTPEPELESLHASHLAHVMLSDFARPAEPDLINSCVGTYCYPDYPNESCMIVHDLDERGLHDDARRRLAVWLKYQGTEGLPGNFTDHNGVLQGCGGFEQGDYNQDHGFVMWALAEHYFLSGDKNWLNQIAPNLIAAADWVTRQRLETQKPLPHSRGWESGFLPAGSLEDVKDYCYWLSTNALTWRGMNAVADALEDIQHPQARRIRNDADAYKNDLIRGFELSRQHSPLVRLRDGRWVPHYPSRIYLRGRDVGWGRETLEGATYLLTSGLFDPKSPQARWILDDLQDNRLTRPPFGYEIANFEQEWFARGGISMQPLLLPALIPYLDRDEPKVYLWMFYNNFNAVYRDEINAICEHPAPILGKSGITFKTSDESNGTAWSRYMFVYSPTGENLLHLGRAIPRKWFDQPLPFELNNVATRFGVTSIRYQPNPDQKTITANVDFRQSRTPNKFLLRFRTPDSKTIKSVLLNDQPYTDFDPAGDVNLTGRSGSLKITVNYE